MTIRVRKQQNERNENDGTAILAFFGACAITHRSGMARVRPERDTADSNSVFHPAADDRSGTGFLHVPRLPNRRPGDRAALVAATETRHSRYGCVISVIHVVENRYKS